MRALGKVALVVSLLLSAASPCAAYTVRIESTAPLADHSEATVKAAIMQAILTAARGAMDNGFPWVALGEVRVLEKEVSIELFATDENPDGGADGAAPAGEAPHGVL